jgi:chloramphenicol 3-O-phosphotransferase
MDGDKVIQGLRASPGVFILQAERIGPGDVFEVDGDRFEVGSELVPIGAGAFLTQVLTHDGRTLGVQLHVGRRA